MDRPLFSEMLSERRRELGYSIRQSSRVLRLKEDVLIAFEEGDFEQMPKSGYAQGMLSSYARYLGLDARDVVEAYVHDLEDYQHDSSRRGRGGRQNRAGSQTAPGSSVGQPYVGSRGLLPTSGGLAGDMGSFATTRVHTRSSEQDNSDTERLRDDAYAPSRPYTGRTPSRQSRTRRSSARSDIRTMELGDYDDDLRLGRDAQPYESATTRRGRRSSRNLGNTQRPRVNRRSREDNYGRGSQGRSGRGDRNGRGRSQGSNLSITPAFALIAVVAIIVITVILVVSVGSCVRQNSDLSHSVPISAKSTSGADSSAQQSSSTSAASDATGTAAKAGTSSTATSKSEETSVSVSVADGAVTWLEISMDGKSDMAQTVTGPWQKTYTVNKTLSIQAGDTTAVTVVQNGQQMQFESMASGIGTLVIEGTGRSASASASVASSRTSASTDSSTTASSTTASSTDSSKSDTAKTGNNSQVSSADGSTGTDETSDESYSEDDEYAYEDEYGSV